MSMIFDPLRFIADHAGLSLADAISEAYKQGQQDAQHVPDTNDGDTISRQAAIAVADRADYRGLTVEDVKKVTDEVVKGLKQLPSAQLEQRWIPVTERLPEDEYVLISKRPTEISGDKWSIAMAIRTADPRSRKIQWRDSGFGVIQDDKVLAWMPLPASFREEGEADG